MAKTVRQNVTGQDSAATATVQCTLSATLAGCVLIAVLIEDGSSGENWTAVSDNINGTTGWQQVSNAAAKGSGSCSTDIWVHLNPGAGVTTVTATRDASSLNPKVIFVKEISGFITPAVDVGSNTVSGTGGTAPNDYTAPAGVASTSDSVIVSGIVSPGTAMTAAPKVGNEFTSDPTSGNDITNSVASATLITTVSGSHTCVFTGNDPAQSFNASTVVLKETGSSAPPNIIPVVVAPLERPFNMMPGRR
jgi:hypothetical protein